MANSMLSFCKLARSQIAANGNVSDILSLRGVDLTLFFRERRSGDPHTVSTWACEMTKAWNFLSSVTRLAAVHYGVSFMRWYILPCPQTYAMLSPLQRPLKEQLNNPHSVSLDLVHLPVVRQAVVTGARSWIDRVTPDIQHFKWSRGSKAAVTETVFEPGSRPVKTLRSDFIKQCDLVSSWTLHESVVRDYPDVPKEIQLHSDDIDPATLEPEPDLEGLYAPLDASGRLTQA
jgi:hypothetical protein